MTFGLVHKITNLFVHKEGKYRFLYRIRLMLALHPCEGIQPASELGDF